MNGDECALSAAELETKVRDGESQQLMGSAPSQVPLAQLSCGFCIFFFFFFSLTLMFHAHILGQKRFMSKAVWIGLQTQF